MEQDSEEFDIATRVNWMDVVAVLFRALTGIFGVIAGFFQNLAILAQAHSNFKEEQHMFRASVAHDIETLGGGE